MILVTGYQFLKINLQVSVLHTMPFMINMYRTKLRKIFDMWVNIREGVAFTLAGLKEIYGEEAYAYNNYVVI